MLIPGHPNYNMDEEYPHSITNTTTGCVLKPSVTRGGYMCYNVQGRVQTRAKWIALCLIPNPENKPCIDHINHDRADDRIVNLRWVTYKENHSNQRSPKDRSDNTSGKRGVCWKKDVKKWHAKIQINGKRKTVGFFDDLEEASMAYEAKRRELGRD